jgi:hypothetical protein
MPIRQTGVHYTRSDQGLPVALRFYTPDMPNEHTLQVPHYSSSAVRKMFIKSYWISKKLYKNTYYPNVK